MPGLPQAAAEPCPCQLQHVRAHGTAARSSPHATASPCLLLVRRVNLLLSHPCSEGAVSGMGIAEMRAFREWFEEQLELQARGRAQEGKKGSEGTASSEGQHSVCSSRAVASRGLSLLL